MVYLIHHLQKGPSYHMICVLLVTFLCVMLFCLQSKQGEAFTFPPTLAETVQSSVHAAMASFMQSVNRRMTAVDQCMTAVDQRMAGVDQRLDSINQRVESHVSQAVQQAVNQGMTQALNALVVTQQCNVAMGLMGVRRPAPAAAGGGAPAAVTAAATAAGATAGGGGRVSGSGAGREGVSVGPGLSAGGLPLGAASHGPAAAVVRTLPSYLQVSPGGQP
jgi:hypothetical protein